MAPFKAMQAFVGFGDADRRALAGLAPLLEPAIESIVKRFYDRVESDPASAAVLRDGAQIRRLQLTLAGWLRRLLAGPWNAEYFALRSRIGRIHQEIGLPQRFMPLGLAVIRAELVALVARELAGDVDGQIAAQRALAKILDLDLAIMLESYAAVDDKTDRLEEVERRLLAYQLEIANQRAQAILEAAEIIVISLTGDCDVELFNRHAELISGYRRSEVLDREDFDRLWHPMDLARVHETVNTTRRGSVSWVDELRMVHKSGGVRHVRWHVTDLPSLDMREVCLVGVDLTAEHGLAARTRRAENLAILGTLAAGLAHEIRNPLNSAQLQLRLASRRLGGRDGAGAGAIESIDLVSEELDRLEILVDDFLLFARPTPVELRPCDLRETTREVAAALEQTATGQQVALVVDAPEAVALDGDEAQLRQLLSNLITNAIDAAWENGGGEVEIGLARRGPSALLTVADTGAGLVDGLDVFAPFVTSKSRGIGLGLPIVMRIVDDHHGRLAVERRGDRTVFEVELPIAAV